MSLALANPARIKLVNAAGKPDEVEAEIAKVVEDFLRRESKHRGVRADRGF